MQFRRAALTDTAAESQRDFNLIGCPSYFFHTETAAFRIASP